MAKKSATLHLPVFDEVVRNLPQETRGPLENVAVASAKAHVRQGKIKLVTRACDGDIKQPAFFFERVARIQRTAAWKHSVGQPDHEHSVKLEAFGLVHRGTVDCFFVARLVRRRFRIDIADQCELRKKIMRVLKLAGESRELI